jgi:hypothetical protein
MFSIWVMALASSHRQTTLPHWSTRSTAIAGAAWPSVEFVNPLTAGLGATCPAPSHCRQGFSGAFRRAEKDPNILRKCLTYAQFLILSWFLL